MPEVKVAKEDSDAIVGWGWVGLCLVCRNLIELS